MTLGGIRLGISLVAALPLLAAGCATQGGGDGAVETLSVCGDGIIEGGESCDDDNDDPRDGCTNECQLPRCGDGIAHEGEVCDDGDEDDTDGCTASCTLGPAAVVSVALGEFHSCALSAQGVVRCWGAPDFGRLGQPGYDEHIGDDETPSDWDPVEVADDVVELVAGADHTCALRQGGQLRCWGNNDFGQLGYAHLDDVGFDDTPAAEGDVPLPGIVVNVGAGTMHTCAVFEGGDVACWGNSGSGRLGLGTEEAPDPMGTVQLPGPAVEVVAGHEHSCARLQSGDVSCWGRGDNGQLGYGNGESIGDDEPVDSAGVVPLGGSAIDIDTFYNHTCAVLEGGTVRCWGTGGSGQLGYGDTIDVGDRKTPADLGDVMLDELAIAVQTGRSHSCAVLVNGNVRCWGNGNALGVPDTTVSNLPELPARIGTSVRTLAAGYTHNCAIVDSAGLKCWGSNTGFVLGYPEVSSNTTITNPSSLGEVEVF